MATTSMPDDSTIDLVPAPETTDEKKPDELTDLLGEIKDALNNPTTQEQLLKMMADLTATTQNILNAQTTAPSLKSKLKSRKFWIAVLAAVAGFCGMLNSGGNTTTLLIFVALEAVSILGYFFTEGTIDSTRTKEMIQAATAIAEILGTVTPTLQASEVNPSGSEVPVNPVTEETGTDNASDDAPEGAFMV